MEKLYTVLHTVPRLDLPRRYLYMKMQRRHHLFCIKNPDRGLRFRKLGPSSISLGYTCRHLQDLGTGWKKESCLPNRGIINSSNQETCRSFLTPGPTGHASNRITSGNTGCIPQACITHSILKESRSEGSCHHFLILSLTQW